MRPAAADPANGGELTVHISDLQPKARQNVQRRAGRVSGSGWAPPKISLTEVSSNTASMASAMIPATESTSILSICFSGGSGSVLVTTTFEITEFLSRSMAGPENTPWVAAA